ncbi:MAG: TetR/AcrR family transcriptional regulator [Corynebacterium sp.]|nr:TetR/AcrR family transcriptional regulator [Corynebacterium sp.]
MNSWYEAFQNPQIRTITPSAAGGRSLERPSRGLVTDSIDSAVVEAARTLIITEGVNRLTMVSVARKAKISRPTLYARYANRLELTREVLNREMVSILDVAFPPPNNVEDLVRTTVTVGRLISDNELLRALIENDPAILITYQYERLGKSQITMIRFLRNIIQRIQQRDQNRKANGQPGPYINPGDPQVMATFVLATVQGVSLQSRILSMMLNRNDGWQEELSKILKGYLVQCPPPTP